MNIKPGRNLKLNQIKKSEETIRVRADQGRNIKSAVEDKWKLAFVQAFICWNIEIHRYNKQNDLKRGLQVMGPGCFCLLRVGVLVDALP